MKNKTNVYLSRLSKTNLSLLLCLVSLISYAQKLSFSHLGLDEGLPQETIHCITEDKNGFIWLGTSDGIVRYDGHDFFVPQPDTYSGLDVAGYRIGALLAHNNYIYIGTGQNGLLRYNLKDESIQQIGETNTNCTRIIKHKDVVIAAYYNAGILVLDGDNEYFTDSVIDQYPQQITGLSAHQNKLYLGTQDGKIYAADLKGLSDSGFDFNFKLLTKINATITNLKTINNTLWITTENGLYRLNDANLEVNKISILKNDTPFNFNISTLVFEGGNYVIGTTEGLLVTSFKNDSFFVIDHYKANKKYEASTINSDGINELFVSKDLLFIGHINLDIAAIKSLDIFEQPTDAFALDNPSVFAVCDTEDYLFIGSSSGLIISSNTTSAFHVLKDYDRIRGIARDNTNHIWFVTNKGVFVIPLEDLDLLNPTVIKIPIDASNPTQLPAENMRSVYKDASGALWITTFNSGFSRFTGNLSQNIFTFKNYSSDQLPSVFTLALVEDRDSNYWMCTQKGLSKLNFKDQELIAVKNYDETDGLATRGVLSAFVDAEHTLWVASRKGLNRYDSKTDSFTSYGRRHGLTNTFVYNINEDDLGNLWLSTNGGLFKFNKSTEEFTNYHPKDGLQSTEFNLGATFKNKTSGELYFGGINGLNIFNPKRIGELDKEGQLRFTSLKIKDTYVSPKSSNVLSESITKAQEITLNYDDFPVNLNFSALDFRPNSNIKYVYKLLPEDTEWNTLDTKNNIQLLNLSSKSYTLQIQGKSRNDLWQQPPLELKLNITPPWYKSNLAYVTYLLLFLGLVFAFYKISLQRQIAGQESKRLQDLDELKSRFITNITHEFRTPLTIILGYLGNLKERFSDKNDIHMSLDTIEQNSHNLLNLVNQMLDLAKLEKGQLNLNCIQGDFVNFSSQIVNSFLSIASDKRITLKFSADPKKIIMDYDAEKWRQVLNNLISNALKFSPQQCELHINILKQNPNTLKIEVSDQGFGIPEDELPFIFDRFYQVENAEHKVSQGTGIGLALTKELIALFKGNITVTSVLDKGTKFSITVPITHNAPEKDFSLIEKQMTIGTVVPQLDDTIVNEDSNSVLIVEDNNDMARYIASCLRPDYKVSFAKNGKEGLDIAESLIPDIIVTDVMMPVMDGYALTEQLQSNTKTDHIPIIMLTSKAMQEDKLEGLSSGADAYLTKPFQKEELRLRMQMLIAKRKKLQSRYAVNAVIDEKRPSTKTIDKKIIFINEVVKVVQAHIDDSNFGPTELAKAMAMSDSQLYRKLKAISNTSTAIFIRQVRLEKAKDLLKTTDLTISEIAYATGFNDPNWFSKTFKDEFQASPSNFRN